jgi:hypothetical protein
MKKAKGRIKTSKRKLEEDAFIELCNRVISANFPFYEIKEGPSKKLPINAFNSFDNTLFKVLPQSNIAAAIKLIKSDVASLKKNKSFSAIIYFTQSSSLGGVIAKNKIENDINTTVPFTILSPADIFSELNKHGDIQKFIDIPRGLLPQLYQSQLQFDYREESLIEELFNYVYTESLDEELLKPSKPVIQKLSIKINHNFAESMTATVKDMYNSNWHVILAVEEYVSDQIEVNSKIILAMYSRIKNKYRELAVNHSHDCPINDPVHFNTIVKSLIPPDRQYSTGYESIALSIVLYFFEMCDFGQRYEGEQLSLLQEYLKDD